MKKRRYHREHKRREAGSLRLAKAMAGEGTSNLDPNAPHGETPRAVYDEVYGQLLAPGN